MAQKTYIGSLWTNDDISASGLDFSGNFYGNVQGNIQSEEIVVSVLKFADGSLMTTAGAGLPNTIDAGTF